MVVYPYTGENLIIMNKPKFIIIAGTGFSASTPLWYTLQVQNKFVHGGLVKENNLLDSISIPPYLRFKKKLNLNKEAKSYTSSQKARIINYSRTDNFRKKSHKKRIPEVKNDIFFTQEELDEYKSYPFTLDKYITYYKKHWKHLQENNCPYQGVGDFSNANAWLPQEFCYKVVDKLSEDFDVKVLLIVRDPIRRLWSEIGGYWDPDSPRQWGNIEEHKEMFFDHVKGGDLPYLQILEKWEKVAPTHVIIMEQLWEGDEQEREKQRLSDFLDYDIKNIHENVYCPDRGPNAPKHLGLKDQWSSDKYWLSDELYNQVLPLMSIYQQWVDRYGSLPLYWGKPYNYEV